MHKLYDHNLLSVQLELELKRFIVQLTLFIDRLEFNFLFPTDSLISN